jgi:hypothetical protein
VEYPVQLAVAVFVPLAAEVTGQEYVAVVNELCATVSVEGVMVHPVPSESAKVTPLKSSQLLGLVTVIMPETVHALSVNPVSETVTE